jgi:DNA-directed RNA polymerase subunit RPC12/RpoP
VGDLNKSLGYLLIKLGMRFDCSACGRALEELGISPDIQALQSLQSRSGSVHDIGDQRVPIQIKEDPFVYRGFFCASCQKTWCPEDAGMQREVCPECKERTLVPAYRPILQAAREARLYEIDLDAFLGRSGTE